MPEDKKVPREHLGAQKPSNNNVRPLFPLDGVDSAVSSFQLHSVFGGISKRVPPNDAPSRFIGFGDKSWDNFKNFFETQ